MMTYGWAILIIVIVAALLYSLGIFNPASSVTAVVVTGLSGLGAPQAVCLPNGVMLLQLGNSVGRVIEITRINAITQQEITQTTTPEEAVQPSYSRVFFIPSICPLHTGERFSLNVVVTYTEPGQVFPGPYTSSGTVYGAVAASNQSTVTFVESGLPYLYPWAVIYNGIKYLSTSQNITAPLSSSGNSSLLFSVSPILNSSGIYNINLTPSPASGRVDSYVVDVTFSGTAQQNTIYVPGEFSGAVYAINTTSYAVTYIKFGGHYSVINGTRYYPSFPHGAGISPNGALVYVGNRTDSDLLVINTATNSNVSFSTVPGISSPLYTYVPPSGNTVYEAGGSYMEEVSLSTNTLTNTISGFCSAHDFSVMSNGNGYVAYVPNVGCSSVSVVNLTSNTIVTTVTGFRCPQSIAITPNGKYAYVVNRGCVAGSGILSNVSVLSTSTNKIIDVIPVEYGPTFIVIPSNGPAGGKYGYVTNYGNNTVSVIQLSSNSVISNIPVCGAPHREQFSEDGKTLYVTCRSGYVDVINTATNSVIETIALPYYYGG
jgi:YVTN family beta-propeller protein